MDTDDTENGEHNKLVRLFNLKSSEKLKNKNISFTKEFKDISKRQAQIVQNALNFQNINIKDIITHRINIKAVSVNSTVGEVVKLSLATGFSRIPVFEKNIDSIVGLIYIKDLLPLIGEKNSLNSSITPFVRDVVFVSKYSKCLDLFIQLTKNHKHMAIVIDEFGGTFGLITLEDLIETIMGNIQDEYDNETDHILKESNNSYIVKSSVNLKDLSSLFNIEINQNQKYETVGELLINSLGRIPSENENPSIIKFGIEFKILSIVNNHISKVRARILN